MFVCVFSFSFFQKHWKHESADAASGGRGLGERLAGINYLPLLAKRPSKTQTDFPQTTRTSNLEPPSDWKSTNGAKCRVDFWEIIRCTPGNNEHV